MPDSVPYLGEFFLTSRRGAGESPGIRPEPYFGPGGTFTGPFGPPPSPDEGPPAEEPLAEVVVEANRPLPPPNLGQAFFDPYAAYIGWREAYIPKPKEPLRRRRAPPRRSPPKAPPRRPRPPKREAPIPPGKKPWWWPKLPDKKPWWWPGVTRNPAVAAIAVVESIFSGIESGIRQTVARAGAGGRSPPPVPWAIAPPLPPPARQPAPAPAPLPWLGTVTVAAPRPLAPPRLFPFAPPMAFPLPTPYAPPLPAPFPDPLPFAPPAPAPRPAPRPEVGFPFSPGRPGTPSYGSPGVATGLQPFPVPKEELDRDKCKCKDKDKKKKKNRSRQKCYRGTYKEFSFGLSKTRKEEIPCLLTAPRKGRKLPRPADILPFPKRI